LAKSRTLLLWIVSVLGALAYAAAGAAKVLGTPEMAEGFTHFGLPLWFMTFIGLCEVAGAVGLLLPRLSFWAASGLAIIMVGAVVLHVTYDDVATAVPALVLLVLMGYIAWQRRRDAVFVVKAPSA
jgi:uncharacterized membrane protein YphA (DoxX/SURF4 family)